MPSDELKILFRSPVIVQIAIKLTIQRKVGALHYTGILVGICVSIRDTTLPNYLLHIEFDPIFMRKFY